MKVLSRTSFTTYINHRAEPYFTFVKNGQKTIEGRVCKGEYQQLSLGDHIMVNNNEETEVVEVVVRRIARYASFRDMLAHEPLKQVLPNVTSIEQGLETYRQFYAPAQEQEFGVVAFEFERVKENSYGEKYEKIT